MGEQHLPGQRKPAADGRRQIILTMVEGQLQFAETQHAGHAPGLLMSRAARRPTALRKGAKVDVSITLAASNGPHPLSPLHGFGRSLHHSQRRPCRFALAIGLNAPCGLDPSVRVGREEVGQGRAVQSGFAASRAATASRVRITASGLRLIESMPSSTRKRAKSGWSLGA